jgi:hypothetical protein
MAEKNEAFLYDAKSFVISFALVATATHRGERIKQVF